MDFAYKFFDCHCHTPQCAQIGRYSDGCTERSGCLWCDQNKIKMPGSPLGVWKFELADLFKSKLHVSYCASKARTKVGTILEDKSSGELRAVKSSLKTPFAYSVTVVEGVVRGNCPEGLEHKEEVDLRLQIATNITTCAVKNFNIPFSGWFVLFSTVI